MENSEKYDLLAEGESGLPSPIAILPRSVQFQFDAKQMESALAKHKDFKLLSFEASDENKDDDPYKSFIAQVEYDETEFNVDLYILDATELNLRDFGFANAIDEESLTAATQQKYMLETSMYFNSDPLASFHLQLKILDALVPDASLVVDFMSYRLLSAKWLKLAANSSVPPSPDYLYTIHGVYDDKGKNGERQYWLHTHGLHRCGSVELEILNFNDGADQMNTLINMSVKKFLFDPIKENEKFAIGYDGLGINLAWLRWEEALKNMPKDILGGMNDRDGDGNVHAEPSGVLFAVEDGELISPQIYASTVSENPIFYITNEETNRMSALAKERFSYFERTFNKESKKPEKKSFFKNLFNKKEEDESKWSFLVKLGLTTDQAETENDREHLWFEVQSIDNGKITGKLLNQPYWIAQLNEGDVNTYPLEVLTDWIIYSPDNTFTPDSVYMLD